MTSKIVDISEYFDFCFYEKFRFNDNAGLSPNEPLRWLCISHQTGGLMCYHIITRTGEIKSRYTVQRVTNLELSND